MSKYRYGNLKTLSVLTLFILFNSALEGVSLYAMKDITDAAFISDNETLINISKLLLVLIVIQFILNLIISKLKAIYMQKSMTTLRAAYIEKLFKLPVLDLSKILEDKYLSHLSNDMDRYEEKFYVKLIDLITIVIQLMISMIILASVSLYLLFFALILLVFFVLMSHKTSKPIAKKEKNKTESLNKYTAFIKESILGFFVVKENNLEINRIKEFKKHAVQVQADNYEVDKKNTHVDALNSFVQIAIILTLIIIGIIFAKTRGMSVGTTLIAGTAFSQSIWPMQSISPYISQMSGISVLLKDFDQVLEKKDDKATLEINKLNSVKFKSANVGYTDVVVSDINISFKDNDKVLLIGDSGAGKSTILRSLRKQLPLLSGELLVNDIALKDIKAKSYFKEIAVVDQIGFIFNDTVLNNITLYKNYDKKDVLDMLAQVGLSDLDLNLILKNNGDNISGGTRARLLLARALFLDASLIICDEILASLDNKTAKAIELEVLKLDKMIINVSHVLFYDNLKYYDYIYLVKDNKVRQVFDFKELEHFDM